MAGGQRDHDYEMTSSGRLSDRDSKSQVYQSLNTSDLDPLTPGAPDTTSKPRQPSYSTYQNYPFDANELPLIHHDQKGSRTRSKWGFAGQEGWLWETGACLMSIVAIMGVVIILVKFQGRPLPDWPLGITINALISLMAIIAKIGMSVVVASCIGQLKWHWFAKPRPLRDFNTFDNASRSPRGSFQLLWRAPLHLASVGALVAIVGILLDPFLQQVVSYSYKTVSVTSSGAASIARAQIYDGGVYPNSGVQMGPESGAKQAFYNGLFAGSNAARVDAICPSGNCTFSPFTSLAMCSQCRNVTDQTKRVLYKDTGRDNVTIPDDQLYNMTFALPGNVNVSASFDEYQGSEMGNGPAMVSTSQVTGGMSSTVFGVNDPLTALAILQWPSVNAEGYNGDYENATPLAWECIMYFCLNVYEVDVESGNTLTTIKATSHESSGINRYNNANIVLELPQQYAKAQSSGNTTYTVSGDTYNVLGDYLNYTLTGQILTEDSEVNSSNDIVNDVLQVINSTSDLGLLFSNVSQSMTAYLRSGVALGPTEDGDAGDYATGDVLQTVPIVAVRWPWLILPFILLLLTTLLLASTMIATRKRHDFVWKSSSLATLYHGIDIGRSTGIEDMNKMEGLAKKEQVVLRRNHAGNLMLMSPE